MIDCKNPKINFENISTCPLSVFQEYNMVGEEVGVCTFHPYKDYSSSLGANLIQLQFNSSVVSCDEKSFILLVEWDQVQQYLSNSRH